jgi:hypothetical protein
VADVPGLHPLERAAVSGANPARVHAVDLARELARQVAGVHLRVGLSQVARFTAGAHLHRLQKLGDLRLVLEPLLLGAALQAGGAVALLGDPVL